jgi:hypothetical protein
MELLGAHQEVLASVGDETSPTHYEGKVVPVVQVEGPPEGGPAKPSAFPMQPVGIAVGAAGVVCIGLASFYQVRINSIHSQIYDATRDSHGRVTGISQDDAFFQAKVAQANATRSRVLYAAGVVGAGVGVTLFILGRPAEVHASPSGVTVGGPLP